MQGARVLKFVQSRASLKAIPKEINEPISIPTVLPNVQTPPKYTLVSLKQFPSLEPTTCVPISTSILGVPLRRDILWRAVVFENDNRRVGASNPPGRSDNGYSRKKIRPQKGSGHARVGDANSPTRHNGGRAMARNAPNDYTTELPSKLYSLAMNTALSYQYRRGNLNVIGGDIDSKTDLGILDIVKQQDKTFKYHNSIVQKFLKANQLESKRLLFITKDSRQNLIKFTEPNKGKIDVIQWQGVQINDILKASRVFIEWDALKSLSLEHIGSSQLTT
ncbi:large ribosomal subunit protein uL4m [Monosporozyma servazzii]